MEGELPNPICSANLDRLILTAYEETIGQVDLEALQERAGLSKMSGKFPPPDQTGGFDSYTFAWLQQTAEEVYGKQQGAELARRAGRVAGALILRTYGYRLGASEAGFQLKTLRHQIRKGLVALAELFNELAGGDAVVEEETAVFRWVMERCPFCRGRRSSTRVCSFMVGLLEEYLFMLSGGKVFRVNEAECAACGFGSDLFYIMKRPQD